MGREEAYAAFLTRWTASGSTVERGSGYLRIIETAKATFAVPVYGFDGKPFKSATE